MAPTVDQRRGTGGRGILGLGTVGLAYVAMEFVSGRTDWLPRSFASQLQPGLWGVLAILALFEAPRYQHFAEEFRAAPKFFASLLFMVAMIGVEVVIVQFVTVVLGIDWHSDTAPLPDTGQWLLLSLNDRLPTPITALLRARLVEMHDFLMLFMLLAFSVLFRCIPPPGIGLGARYCFTIALSRVLRFLTFASTILPAVRPWCAAARFGSTSPRHPHPWAQKYFVPYARNHDLLHQVIETDRAFAPQVNYPPEFSPDWGVLQFLVDFLRPMDARVHHGAAATSGAFSSFVIRPYGGCNDLAFSGHIITAALTACAWQEAFPGWASAMVWGLVFHSAQREVRERQHYSVDVVLALYLAPLLWRTTKFLWSRPPPPPSKREALGLALSQRESVLTKALKDGDLSAVREAVEDAEKEAEAVSTAGCKEGTDGDKAVRDEQMNKWLLPFGIGMILVLFVVVLTAFSVADEGGGFLKWRS